MFVLLVLPNPPNSELPPVLAAGLEFPNNPPLEAVELEVPNPVDLLPNNPPLCRVKQLVIICKVDILLIFYSNHKNNARQKTLLLEKGRNNIEIKVQNMFL